jgi:tetratricopeptide (TPR) repeat protein
MDELEQEKQAEVGFAELAPQGRTPVGEVMADLDGADHLLLESEATQPLEPERSEELARLALRIAARPHPARLVGRAEAVKARGLCLLGNARRLLGDLYHAEESLRRAAYHLLGPPESGERARYCWLLALLRRDQGRGQEAVGLLWRAARIYGDLGDRVEEGECLAALGFFFLERGEPERAVDPLRRSREVLEGRGSPELLERVRRALAAVELTDDPSGGHEGPGFLERRSTMNKKHEAETGPQEEGAEGVEKLRPRRPVEMAQPIKAAGVQQRLKAERVQDALKTMPGWKLTAEDKAIDRVYSFTSAALASAFAGYVTEAARLSETPVDLSFASATLVVTLSAPLRGGGRGVTENVLAFAKQLR